MNKAALILAIILSACGGGGDSGNPDDTILCNTQEECPITGPVIDRRVNPIEPARQNGL